MTDSLPPPGYELVFPFIVTQPEGPLDNRAYVVGYETGIIDARLKHEAPALLELYVHTVGVAQLDLLAMRYFYDLVTEQLDETWTLVIFTKMDGSDG